MKCFRMKVHLHRHLWSSSRRACCKNSNSLPIHWYRLVEDNKEPMKLVIIHSSTGNRSAIKRYPTAEVISSVLMQVVIKNILESCVSEIDILPHQRPTSKYQQSAREVSFLCFKTFSKSIGPVEEEGEKLWSLLLRLVNIQSLFHLNPLHRTMPEEPC